MNGYSLDKIHNAEIIHLNEQDRSLIKFVWYYLIVRINIITQWIISLPFCALLIYLDAPLYLVFGAMLFDEVLKWQPFRKTLGNRLAYYENTKQIES